MPNLIPQSVLDRFYFGWAHPAGRLIFALLALAIGMSFVFALIRPPLEAVPEPEPAVEEGKVLRTSRFGRPVKSKA